MKIVLPIRLSILAALCTCISTALQAQQLKLGTTPTVIQKSALLELESTKQGLLLTRISDTLSAPLNTALDGTIIYFTPDKSLRVRANGIWQKLGSGVGLNDYIQNLSAGTQTASFSINGSGSIGGTLGLPSLASGSVLFMNGANVAQNSTNFFWDIANSRLGVGTNTPNNKLEVAGTTAATGTSGLRLKDLGTATVQAYNSKVLSINNNGDVIVTTNAGANNWLITGNTGIDQTLNFLGTTDDKKMSLRSNNQPYLEFGRRQTLGLTEGYTDYTDNDEKVTWVRSALQFEVPPAVSFYKPKMWTTTDGNFRIKGASAGTDYFEMGATGTANNGGFEFIIGDDGDEPILFKSYNYATTTFTEMMRLQSGKVGIGTNALPVRKLEVQGDMRLTASAGTPTSLLGRDANGDIANMAINTTTLGIATGTLTANNNSNIWNANKVQNRNVLDSVPGTGDVLKWNPTRSLWLPSPDITGGASYGTLASTDIRNADAPDANYRMKIWAGPPSAPAAGTVSQGPLGTTAFAWSVLSFQNAAYTTQLYFDKNTLALREWQGNTAPLTANAGPPANPWYKVVTTHGDNIFTDGGLIFAGKTSDASTEVKQDDANLHWDNTNKELGIGTNAPASTLDVRGSLSMPIRSGTTNTTLTADDYTFIKTGTGNATINIPAANTCAGRIYIVKRVSATGSVFIKSTTGTLDGTSLTAGSGVTFTATANRSWMIQSDGTNWYILAQL
ncbi:hypothetical protein SAMN04488505_10620 [Chitinophaga rupis]|uniref:Uncharacterized protein n=1 Tax=Chitinophaga rupis TaxID=573321 RepID=A0A1H8AUT2_9BACT|nr:hypothetical protein [Chitinophaga rupis]SEM74246.1 hypothetical protein SAMN04488505_10620 [Chitinophaga rupis]